MLTALFIVLGIYVVGVIATFATLVAISRSFNDPVDIDVFFAALEWPFYIFVVFERR